MLNPFHEMDCIALILFLVDRTQRELADFGPTWALGLSGRDSCFGLGSILAQG